MMRVLIHRGNHAFVALVCRFLLIILTFPEEQEADPSACLTPVMAAHPSDLRLIINQGESIRSRMHTACFSAFAAFLSFSSVLTNHRPAQLASQSGLALYHQCPPQPGSTLGLFPSWWGNPDLMNPLTFFSPEKSGAEEPLINNNLGIITINHRIKHTTDTVCVREKYFNNTQTHS